MPSYNAGRYIKESIDSVLAQTYENWELLITDDASKDNSFEIIQRYCEKDSRINLLVSKQNHGIAKTRNLSIERAKGRFIAFLDNDDLWLPEKLERQVNFMLENGYAFTYTSYELIDNEGVSMNKVILTQGVMDYGRYSRNTIIGCGTVMIDRDVVGDFRMPQNDTSDDMALWLSLMKKGFKAYPLNEVLLKYRITNNSASSKKLKAASDVWKVYRINEGMSWIKATSCFMGYAFNAVKKRVI
jgi:teichuronic acid biosynthesis glycosyltransferase TuaG